MGRFAHLACAVIDPAANRPTRTVLNALIAQGGNPRVTLAPSSYGALLIMFESHAAREHAMQNSPFLGREHVVSLERHEDTDNRFHFDHEALVVLNI